MGHLHPSKKLCKSAPTFRELSQKDLASQKLHPTKHILPGRSKKFLGRHDRAYLSTCMAHNLISTTEAKLIIIPAKAFSDHSILRTPALAIKLPLVIPGIVPLFSTSASGGVAASFRFSVSPQPHLRYICIAFLHVLPVQSMYQFP